MNGRLRDREVITCAALEYALMHCMPDATLARRLEAALKPISTNMEDEDLDKRLLDLRASLTKLVKRKK